MKLREIYQNYKKPFFKLKQTGSKKHQLRPLTLHDQAWLGDNFSKEFPDLSVDVRSLCKIVFNQLVDRSFLAKQEISIIDESGESTTVEKGGVDLLLTLAQGAEDLCGMLQAWVELIGINKEAQEEIVKKKITLMKQTGV